MTSSVEIETFFSPLLNNAAQLSEDALALIDELLDPDCTFGSMPQAAIYRLHLVATSTYRAGLFCLRAPETSFNSYSLLRGLLEAWSHLEFIADSTGGGSPACRALRYELGALREWGNTLHAAPSYFDKGPWLETHNEKEQDLQKLWDELGCSGPLRTYSHVEPNLKKLAKQPHMEWAPGIWRAASATVHMYGVDFAFATENSGTNLVWALPSYRATWFAFTVATYGYLTAAAAKILNEHDPRIIELHERTKALAEDAQLRKIGNKEFDLGYLPYD